MSRRYCLYAENGNDVLLGKTDDASRAIAVANKLQDIISKLSGSTATFSVWEEFCGDPSVSALVYKASKYVVK